MRGKRSVLVGSLDVAWARQEGSVDANVFLTGKIDIAKSCLDFSLVFCQGKWT